MHVRVLKHHARICNMHARICNIDVHICNMHVRSFETPCSDVWNAMLKFCNMHVGVLQHVCKTLPWCWHVIFAKSHVGTVTCMLASVTCMLKLGTFSWSSWPHALYFASSSAESSATRHTSPPKKWIFSVSLRNTSKSVLFGRTCLEPTNTDKLKLEMDVHWP